MARKAETQKKKKKVEQAVFITAPRPPGWHYLVILTYLLKLLNKYTILYNLF